MEIASETPTKEIKIQGVNGWIVPLPFTEGYTLKTLEADQLNQVLHENIRNNFAKTVEKALKEQGDDFDQEALQRQLNEYLEEYEFGARRGGTFRAADPIEAEAMNIARDLVKEGLKRRGVKLKDFSPADITAEAIRAIEKYPQITTQAEESVAARRKAADGIQLDLNVTPAGGVAE